jgi:4-hydroxy-4-methyl-2-oxoglutarate aldolase
MQDLINALTGIPTGNVCDANDKGGNMNATIKPLDKKMHVVGKAFTVRCQPGDNLTIHKAIYEAPVGSVLVIDAQGFTNAGAFGDILATACMQQGIVGLVLDGACRDANDIEAMGFPVFCKTTNPGGTVKESVGILNQPIQCGGLMVHPGDLVVGDRDGVAVIPQSKAEQVINDAIAKNQKEEEIRQRILEGVSTIDLLGLDSKL